MGIGIGIGIGICIGIATAIGIGMGIGIGTGFGLGLRPCPRRAPRPAGPRNLGEGPPVQLIFTQGKNHIDMLSTIAHGVKNTRKLPMTDTTT